MKDNELSKITQKFPELTIYRLHAKLMLLVEIGSKEERDQLIVCTSNYTAARLLQMRIP